MTEAIAVDRLRSFVQRVESLDEEIKALNADKSEVYKEAESDGFDKKALKEVVRRRAKDQGELQLFDATVDTYLAALGEPPMGGAASAAKRFADAMPAGSSVSGPDFKLTKGADGKMHAEAAE